MKCAKDKQVARCGNAVPPPFAEALVRANLPEMCLKKTLQHDKTRFGGFFNMENINLNISMVLAKVLQRG
ncbi:hypothetical protein KD913_25485 [Klebsiella pneumoniae]